MRWGRALQLLAGMVAVTLLASAAWTVIAVRAVAPRTSPGDVLALIAGPDQGPGSLAQKIKSNERINLLFLAHGGAGNDNPNFTDTMLVLSIRPASHQATVISLPRYLWVDIPAAANGPVQGKLYSAFAIGAAHDTTFLREQWRAPTGPGDLAAATVATTIGQPIDAWIAVDIKAFTALIDAIGGVRVTIPEALDDPQYPSDEEEKTIHIHFDAGAQVLDGTRALQYARSRLSTSEADRSRRQELVLFAILGKLKGGVPIGPSLITAAGPIKDGVRTNLTPPDANLLLHLISALRQPDVTSVTLEDSPMLTPENLGLDQDVLVPKTGSYQQVQAYIAGKLP